MLSVNLTSIFRGLFGEMSERCLLQIAVVSTPETRCLLLINKLILLQTVGQARVLREVARQGLLPYPEFFASTKPFGTPLAPVALKYFLTLVVILALPAKDAFNFLLDLASYPHLVHIPQGLHCMSL